MTDLHPYGLAGRNDTFYIFAKPAFRRVFDVHGYIYTYKVQVMPHRDKERRAAYLREWRNRNREYVRAKCREKNASPHGFAIAKNARLKAIYGITLLDYNEMFEKQNGLCFICGNPEISGISRDNNLLVDHNHATGKVRKLLCNNCNRGLGAFRDNIAIMERAIQYIKDHQ